MKPDDAKLHIKRTIDRVHALNQKKTDAFMETLVSKRPDLAGLSFAMGDACRMKERCQPAVRRLLGRCSPGLFLFPSKPFGKRQGKAKDGDFQCVEPPAIPLRAAIFQLRKRDAGTDRPRIPSMAGGPRLSR